MNVLYSREKPAFLHHENAEKIGDFKGCNMALRNLAVFIVMVFNSCFNKMNFDSKSFFLVNANQWMVNQTEF